MFDLGGVVFRWQPDAIIASVFDEKPARELVKKAIFEHPDWINLDRGTISVESAINRGATRTGLPAREIARLLHAVPVFLTPIDQTIELIRRLGGTANNLFVLSNMHLASIAHLEQQHDIWGLFDGVVISSRINRVKPEIEIYEYLLDTFQLRPGETVFIDDMPENLETASSLGLKTIRFLNPVQCEQALVEHQCL